MQNVYLNGKDYNSMEEIHGFLAEELDFPDYYGKNLSALYDVLTEICEDTKIIINMDGVTDDNMLDELERMTEVINDAAGENDYLEMEYGQE